jgi:hypothetical protein
MAYTNAARNIALDAIGSAAAFIGFHIADPQANGASGASEVVSSAYSRQQTAWSSASSGSKVGTAVTSTIPANTTVTFWSLWSAATGGTFMGSWQLAAPESYGAQGTIVFTPTLTAT